MIAVVLALQLRVITLSDAVQLARVRSERVREGAADAAASSARADQALSVLLPQLRVSASYDRSTSNFAPAPGTVPSSLSDERDGPSPRMYDWLRAGVSASQVVFDWSAI